MNDSSTVKTGRIAGSKFAQKIMSKKYEEPILSILILQEELIRTSTGKDPFDDGYTDFGENE